MLKTFGTLFCGSTRRTIQRNCVSLGGKPKNAELILWWFSRDSFVQQPWCVLIRYLNFLNLVRSQFSQNLSLKLIFFIFINNKYVHKVKKIKKIANRSGDVIKFDLVKQKQTTGCSSVWVTQKNADNWLFYRTQFWDLWTMLQVWNEA